MSIKKRIIEKALREKGFCVEETHHRYFHHTVDGKKSGVSTNMSHGSDDDIGDNLVNMMKRQLRLQTTKQARDLFQCPMSGEEYIELLRKQGVIR